MDRGNAAPTVTIHFCKTMLIVQGNRRQRGGEARREQGSEGKTATRSFYQALAWQRAYFIIFVCGFLQIYPILNLILAHL